MTREVVHRPLQSEVPPRMSYDAWLAWSEREGSLTEWVDGEAIVVEMPSELHQTLVLFLARLVADFLDLHPTGRVFIAPMPMRLPSRPSGREPDILFVRADHLDRFVDGYLDGPADLVVEIVSDGCIGRDTRDKRVEYATAVVPESWIIDPRPHRRRATFLQLDADGVYQEVACGADGRFRSTVVPSFWLDPTWFWQEPLPNLVDLRAAIAAGG